MLAETNIDSTATRPTAPNLPVIFQKRVRAEVGQANRAATGAKYHYPIAQSVPDPYAAGRVPIQGRVGNDGRRVDVLFRVTPGQLNEIKNLSVSLQVGALNVDFKTEDPTSAHPIVTAVQSAFPARFVILPSR